MTVRVEGYELVIRIGISTLAWAAEHGPYLYYDEHCPEGRLVCKVKHLGEYAKDTVYALTKEEEDGATPLGGLLDQIARDVADDGSTALSYPEDEK